jgi:hypothetical protein
MSSIIVHRRHHQSIRYINRLLLSHDLGMLNECNYCTYLITVLFVIVVCICEHECMRMCDVYIYGCM